MQLKQLIAIVAVKLLVTSCKKMLKLRCLRKK